MSYSRTSCPARLEITSRDISLFSVLNSVFTRSFSAINITLLTSNIHRSGIRSTTQIRPLHADPPIRGRVPGGLLPQFRGPVREHTAPRARGSALRYHRPPGWPPRTQDTSCAEPALPTGGSTSGDVLAAEGCRRVGRQRGGDLPVSGCWSRFWTGTKRTATCASCTHRTSRARRLGEDTRELGLQPRGTRGRVPSRARFRS